MFDIQQLEQVQQQGGPEKAHLKPERVQEMLRKLPWWRLGAEGQSITRRRQFTSLGEAQAFVRRVSELAGKFEQPVRMVLSGKRVDLTLAGRPLSGRFGGLTMDVFNLASQIG